MSNTPNLNLFQLVYDNTKKVVDFFMNEIVSKINNNFTILDIEVSNKINKSEKGTANGLATLGEDTLIPKEQIPTISIEIGVNEW